MQLNDSKTLFAAAILGMACSQGSWAQTTPVLLEIELANIVGYVEDTSDVSKFATIPTVTPSGAVKNFVFQEHLADIVAVNGRPVKGTLVPPTPPGILLDTTEVLVA